MTVVVYSPSSLSSSQSKRHGIGPSIAREVMKIWTRDGGDILITHTHMESAGYEPGWLGELIVPSDSVRTPPHSGKGEVQMTKVTEL